MISLGCRGLGIIYQLDLEAQRRLFNFGAHLGIAFQVHDDILDYTQNSAQLGKPAYNDIKEVRISRPISVLGHRHLTLGLCLSGPQAQWVPGSP